MQILAKTYTPLSLTHSGYIAGSADGIVTVQGKPASRKIWLLDAQTMAVERVVTSLKNGHYMLLGLDPRKRYMIIVRDFEPDGVKWTGEAAAWDYVAPMEDISLDEQQALWASWNTV